MKEWDPEDLYDEPINNNPFNWDEEDYKEIERINELLRRKNK